MSKPTKFTATHAGHTFIRNSKAAYTHAIVVEKSTQGLTFVPERLSADGKSFFCNACWSTSLENAQKTAARDAKSLDNVVAVHILPAVAV